MPLINYAYQLNTFSKSYLYLISAQYELILLQKYEKKVVIKENFIPKPLHYNFLFLPEKLLKQTYELK